MTVVAVPLVRMFFVIQTQFYMNDAFSKSLLENESRNAASNQIRSGIQLVRILVAIFIA
jgi:hypothetical protein